MFGIRPIADSINTLTKAAVDGASAFLSRICLPASEELGFLLRDKVSSWRAKNALSIIAKCENKFREAEAHVAVRQHAHPRIVISTIEHGSWSESELVQNMWAGLLASSCTASGDDESNLIFVNLLTQLTSTEAKVLAHICEFQEKVVSDGPWVVCKESLYTLPQLEAITSLKDMHRIDRELDHLRALQLINGGFFPTEAVAHIEPTPLALQMYVRCQGYNGSPKEFFNRLKGRG